MFGSNRNSVVYSGCYIFFEGRRKYIPLIKVDAHTTILSTSSRTTLTQTFHNPHNNRPLEEVKYVFPLYEGVSVSSFTCIVGDRVLHGQVKERQRAKKDYQDAITKGQSAGIFEQSLDASDVFTTAIGNVPAGGEVKVNITYLGELKYDAESEGVRFTIPTNIAPRYGQESTLQSSTVSTTGQGFSVTVDVDMPQGCTIRSVQSPSHPMSVNIGSLSTSNGNEGLSLLKANASLALGSTTLDSDFVVQAVVNKLGEPSAVVETHPSIPHQRAVMTTLVPKFKLPQEKPEIVFICDRSGSMGTGQSIPNLKSALNIFLRSLPVGVKFNICSFGSRYEFLFDKAQTYSQESLDEAVQYASRFSADFGGTEIHAPLEEAFKRRYNDMNLEVFLLTDGEVWNQQQLFDLINSQVRDGKGNARVFTLGIGNNVSHSLIEGIARAGRGFAQTVAENEKMDKKVVRMLKAALTPHVNDYSLTLNYNSPEVSESDDMTEDFEVVEKVMDALRLEIQPSSVGMTDAGMNSKPTVSLFQADLSDDDDDALMTGTKDFSGKYDHLPLIPNPRYLQAPSVIPPLFPFNRTNVYVLLSDDTPKNKLKSVTLHGTSSHGPLELEIPINQQTRECTTIHQLAAKKAIQELEEGRGWITEARDNDSGKLLKEKFEGKFPDMVEREAVRLGVTFQVAGKWCSYVAVEQDGQENTIHQPERLYDTNNSQPGGVFHQRLGALPPPPAPMAQAACFVPSGSARATAATVPDDYAIDYSDEEEAMGFALFDDNVPPDPKPTGTVFGEPPPLPGGGLFGSLQSATTGSALFGSSSGATAAGGLFGLSSLKLQTQNQHVDRTMNKGDSTDGAIKANRQRLSSMKPSRGGLFGATPKGAVEKLVPMGFSDFGVESTKKVFNKIDPLQAVTSLQAFSGSWSWSDALEEATGVTKDRAQKTLGEDLSGEQLATVVAIAFLETILASEEESWEMLVYKAKDWLRDGVGDDRMEKLLKATEGLFRD